MEVEKLIQTLEDFRDRGGTKICVDETYLTMYRHCKHPGAFGDMCLNCYNDEGMLVDIICMEIGD